jgi:hypothetical protein
MIIGIYFFVICAVVGRRINRSHIEGLETMDKDSCCESRVLLPEWLFKYLMFMIRGGYEKKLELFIVVGFLLYTLLVFLASWLLGLVLFRSTDDLGKVYGYGFALYLIIEFVVAILLLVGWFARSAIYSMKKMQDYEISFDSHLLENQDEDDGRDKITKMAEHMSLNSV